MKYLDILKEKKVLIIEALVAVLIFVGGYYVISFINSDGSAVTVSSANEQLLGQNFIVFLQVTTQEKINLDTVVLLNKSLVEKLRDYSEDINPTITRGRLDPFTPYATTRSLR